MYFSVNLLAERRGFLRNPHKLPLAPCSIHCQCLLAQASLDRQTLSMFCGETGIRTPETLLEFTRFPGVPLQPLEHLSLRIFLRRYNHHNGGITSNSATKVLQIIDIRKFFDNYFLFSHILWRLFAYIKKIYYLCTPIKNTNLYVHHRHCGRYRLG